MPTTRSSTNIPTGTPGCIRRQRARTRINDKATCGSMRIGAQTIQSQAQCGNASRQHAAAGNMQLEHVKAASGKRKFP
eukprot:1754426-Pyramimonas_sp.AAC.3